MLFTGLIRTLSYSPRRILKERHGYRIAVIMNEFGDTADLESEQQTPAKSSSD